MRAQSFSPLHFPELLTVGLAPRTAGSGKAPAWIFDLDSTLFCVGPRIKNIYESFLRDHPQPPLRWQKVVEFLDPLRVRYNLEECFQGIFSEWDSHQARAWARELWQEFEPYWEERFFSSRHLHHDEPYAGAVEAAIQVLKGGAEVVYLTGRDLPRCGAGTYAALRDAGFPLGQHNTHLFLKPRMEQADLDYKHQVAAELRARFDVRILIDNEPENLVMFAREFPLAEIVFFHSVMSERVPAQDYAAALNGRKAWTLAGYL